VLCRLSLCPEHIRQLLAACKRLQHRPSTALCDVVLMSMEQQKEAHHPRTMVASLELLADLGYSPTTKVANERLSACFRCGMVTAALIHRQRHLHHTHLCQ
jgi:hypothetical protein